MKIKGFLKIWLTWPFVSIVDVFNRYDREEELSNNSFLQQTRNS